MLNANWIVRADTRIPSEAVDSVAKCILKDARLVGAIWEQDEGSGDDDFLYTEACLTDAGIEVDPWIFFGKDGASKRSNALATTVDLIHQQLDEVLRSAPTKLNYEFDD